MSAPTVSRFGTTGAGAGYGSGIPCSLCSWEPGHTGMHAARDGSWLVAWLPSDCGADGHVSPERARAIRDVGKDAYAASRERERMIAAEIAYQKASGDIGPKRRAPKRAPKVDAPKVDPIPSVVIAVAPVAVAPIVVVDPMPMILISGPKRSHRPSVATWRRPSPVRRPRGWRIPSVALREYSIGAIPEAPIAVAPPVHRPSWPPVSRALWSRCVAVRHGR